MIMRHDLLDEGSPAGLEVIQLTSEERVPSCHVYMEAQIFTPDSKRLVLHRSATPHGGRKDDPEHRYVVCDLEDGCRLQPITEELGATAPSVSPDGGHLYYFVDETEINGGRLRLKRVRLDGSQRETLMVIDSPLPGTGCRPSLIYPLSTISSDGAHLALSCFLGDGVRACAPWGLMVFSLEKAEVRLVLAGPTWSNIHPQYCRSREIEASRDLLVQENHGDESDAQGHHVACTDPLGADIHVIRDDGSRLRNMPWGRDGREECQGHQCWRGRSSWAITSLCHSDSLPEGQAGVHEGHTGRNTAGARRNELNRTLTGAFFSHFATDEAGRRFISDAALPDGGRLVLGEFGENGQEAMKSWTHLLSPRCSYTPDTHIHPFLSPDGKLGFFNSDESGLLQAYLIRGL